MLPTKVQNQQIYHIAFDEYQQPQQLHTTRKLQFDEQSNKHYKPELHLKLLELSVARPGRVQLLLGQIKEKFTEWTLPRPKIQTMKFSEKVLTYAKESRLKSQLSKVHFISNLKLPNFLGFLRARNDDGLCKRKSGFEIYCELASFHGFVNFVDAKTWQRAFWCLMIFIAMLMSTIVLVMSHLLSVDTPIIMYTESTHHPAWTIAFPAITICNLNRMSRRRSEQLATKFINSTDMSKQQMLQLFYLSLSNLGQFNATKSEHLTLHHLLVQNNYTLPDFVKEISPNCETEMLRCKWKGRIERCGKLFQKIATPQGMCCAFNYHAVPRQQYGSLAAPRQTTSCGYKTGLSVLLDPHVDDYMAGLLKSPGYQLLIHDPVNYPADSVEREYVQSSTETSITIVPYATYATEYLRSENLHVRRCFFADEGRLLYFSNGTQTNCLTECRAKILANICGCVPWYLWWQNGTRVCDLTDTICLLEHKEIFYRILNESRSSRNYKDDRYAENFICDCYSECSYNKYYSSTDVGQLDRNFTEEDKRLFKGIEAKDHILLHIFYGDLVAQKYRLDVYENWLSFVGTFGGITGLYMGYSFVSGFEMIFFVFVRPLCNWLTKKEIRYKVKKRQKKAAAEAVRKVLEKEQQTNSGAISQNMDSVTKGTS